MPEKLIDDKSTLVQVMAWCRHATSIAWAKVDCCHVASLGLNELTLHCTISPHWGHSHASMDPVAATNAFSCNLANNGHRNSIQLSNLCAMGCKGISKITFNIQWNLKQIWHSWHTWVSKGIKGFQGQWGLSGLISMIRPGLAAWPGRGDFFEWSSSPC